MKNFLNILLNTLVIACTAGCTGAHQIEIKYVKPDIPESIIAPCESLQGFTSSIVTNGDLLMAYISLTTAYTICASKVNSIRDILDSYKDLYK